MKKLALALLAVATLFTAHPRAYAAIVGAPFIPEIDARFDCLESSQFPNCKNQPSHPGVLIGQVSVVAGSGASVSSPLVIPPNNIITQTWLYVKTQLAPSGTKIAVKCLTAGDILAATDESGQAAGVFLAGIQDGTTTHMLASGSSGCTLVFTDTVHAATAGVFDVYADITPIK